MNRAVSSKHTIRFPENTGIIWSSLNQLQIWTGCRFFSSASLNLTQGFDKPPPTFSTFLRFDQEWESKKKKKSPHWDSTELVVCQTADFKLLVLAFKTFTGCCDCMNHWDLWGHPSRVCRPIMENQHCGFMYHTSGTNPQKLCDLLQLFVLSNWSLILSYLPLIKLHLGLFSHILLCSGTVNFILLFYWVLVCFIYFLILHFPFYKCCFIPPWVCLHLECLSCAGLWILLESATQ